MIVYVDNLMKPIIKSPKLTDEFNKVSRYKTKYLCKSQLCFCVLAINTWKWNLPVTVVPNNMKYIIVN